MKESAAFGLVFNQAKTEIALVKRKDVPVWVLPGGGVDPGETFEQAALREIKEETGLTAQLEQTSALYMPVNRLASYTKVFECSIVGGELTACPEETSAIEFFSVNKLPKDIFFVHRLWINDFFLPAAKPLIQYLSYVSYKNLLLFIARHPIWMGRFMKTRFSKKNRRY